MNNWEINYENFENQQVFKRCNRRPVFWRKIPRTSSTFLQSNKLLETTNVNKTKSLSDLW